MRKPLILISVFVAIVLPAFALAPWVHEQPEPGDFPLVHARQAAVVLVSPEDHAVARVATDDFAADVERVTGLRPIVAAHPLPAGGPVVLVGTLGKNAIIDGLASSGRLDVSALRGAWESFIITTVEAPAPGVSSALVIVGSDRRGTAFGVYELSQAIGVSPWYWWADVTPEKKTALHVAAGTRRFGPPSVQYRGIFLNDEDWGLQPWAAKTFEPEVGDIGPKTYAKICELLLRLKANTLWPAMHACTKAFNLYPQNKLVADNYAIVMGSSHAEPMLRNNVTEWTAPHEDYNYVTNREGVRNYWEQRVQENGKFENIYTLGMRGIHDSNMQGPKTDAERIATLEQIFADQRAMLAKHVNPDVEQVPQMFCAYKEVLDLYRQGLKVPDDVTIVWPDDNFGYIRNFATPEEQKRSGGFGVYYHISYLGRPLSYLWLSTTPPALIWEEMHKAYEHGARKLWIVNVGDLKPAEIGTEFFLQMAWDIDRWNADNLDQFLPEWAAREFGVGFAPAVADVMKRYYAYNFLRKPEHLQWWLPKQPVQPSPLSANEITRRLTEGENLRKESDRIRRSLFSPQRDAFFELVDYPVAASTLANERYFLNEIGADKDATLVHRRLEEYNHQFNTGVLHVKWNHVIALEPASNEWQSMRIADWKIRQFPPKPFQPAPLVTVQASDFHEKKDQPSLRWRIIEGLGQGRGAVSLLPSNSPAIATGDLLATAPALSYEVDFPEKGPFTVTFYLLPTHPIVAGRGLRFAVGVDATPPQSVICDVKDGSEEWAQGVLNNFVKISTALSVPTAGKHLIKLYGVDAGVLVDKFTIEASAANKPTIDPQ